MLGTRHVDETETPEPIDQADFETYLVDQDSRLGLLTRVGPAIEFEKTPSMCIHAASSPGTDTLDLAWGPDAAGPLAVPHRPTQIFKLRQVHWEADQTL